MGAPLGHAFIRRSSTHRTAAPRDAFTLVEMIMVVTLIGIIAAIAVPRVTSTTSQSGAHALRSTLGNVRSAIDMYYAEHNRFPGYDPASGTPSGEYFIKQLTLYSDSRGHTSTTSSSTHAFGPYLRAPFPANPANKLRSVSVKATPATPDPADGTVGWVAVLSTGDFGVSATDAQLDDVGILKAPEKLEVRSR